MVFGVPLIKLFPLAFKFFSSPATAALKKRCQKSPKFAARVIRWAKWYNKQTVILRYKINGIKRSKEQIEIASKINEQKAIDMGVEIFMSGIALIIGLGLLLVQQYLQEIDARQKQAKQEKERQDRLAQIDVTNADLDELKLGLKLVLDDLKIVKTRLTNLETDFQRWTTTIKNIEARTESLEETVVRVPKK